MGSPASDRVPRARPYSGVICVRLAFAYGTFTLFGVSFQTSSANLLQSRIDDPQPRMQASGLASFPFARRYLGNRCFFLFLLLLRCFSSEGFLHTAMDSLCSDKVLPYRVSPFGNLRVYGYLLLTAAYRSLSRPSSAPDAKSFSLRSL